ncbi:MAG TPA: porin family protein [Mariprofundaceae bacterium]|nr:porin family protein [Mariprofundaceae bacterium]
MRQLIYAIPVALGLLTAPAAASAQEFMFEPYAGAGVGGFLLNDGNGSNFVFGGYGEIGAKLAQYMAIEGRFGTAGSKTKYDAVVGANVKNQVDWFASYLFKPQVILARGLRFYGLLGATTLKSSITATGSTKVSKTNTDFSYGVGMEYSPNDDNLYVGAEWMRYASSESHATLTTTTYSGMNMQGYVATLRYAF